MRAKDRWAGKFKKSNEASFYEAEDWRAKYVGSRRSGRGHATARHSNSSGTDCVWHEQARLLRACCPDCRRLTGSRLGRRERARPLLGGQQHRWQHCAAARSHRLREERHRDTTLDTPRVYDGHVLRRRARLAHPHPTATAATLRADSAHWSHRESEAIRVTQPAKYYCPILTVSNFYIYP